MLTRSDASILVPMTTSHRIPPAPSAPLQAQAAASSTPAQPVRTSSPAPLPQAGGPAPGTPASDAVILTHDLAKTFGSRTVVEGLNLVVPRGAVYGFLGPNGSGKSTTMKMLLSLIEPSDGEVQILGKSMTRATRRSLLGRIGSLI